MYCYKRFVGKVVDKPEGKSKISNSNENVQSVPHTSSIHTQKDVAAPFLFRFSNQSIKLLAISTHTQFHRYNNNNKILRRKPSIDRLIANQAKGNSGKP